MEKLIICGGCNAKIGAGNLKKLLEHLPRIQDKNLLVGYDSSDDAAVTKLTNDMALIQTLDFFPAMVADPYVFGKIAAANALSDIYAMGGEPLSALNIVAFPEEKDLSLLEEILRGGAEKVKESGATLAGGHSIHDSSVKYGLSVTGLIHPEHIYHNDGCNDGDHLILTKPLGVSILAVGYSIGEISEKGFRQAAESMQRLNKYAVKIIKDFPISGCTDVTGFGLLGHLLEMLHGSFSAEINHKKIPYFEEAYEGARNFIYTAGGQRNRNYLQEKINFQIDDFPFEEILYDPQTSGGLLISVPAKHAASLVTELRKQNVPARDFGKIIPVQNKAITVY